MINPNGIELIDITQRLNTLEPAYLIKHLGLTLTFECSQGHACTYVYPDFNGSTISAWWLRHFERIAEYKDMPVDNPAKLEHYVINWVRSLRTCPRKSAELKQAIHRLYKNL